MAERRMNTKTARQITRIMMGSFSRSWLVGPVGVSGRIHKEKLALKDFSRAFFRISLLAITLM